MRFSDHVSVSNNSLIFVSLEHCSLEFKLELLAFSSGPESFLLLLPPRLPTVPNPKTFGCLQEEAGMRLQSRIQRSSAPVFFLFLFGVSSRTLLHSCTGASAAATAAP